MANKKDDDNLKGTLYATFGVGAVILITWIVCYGLFIDRF